MFEFRAQYLLSVYTQPFAGPDVEYLARQYSNVSPSYLRRNYKSRRTDHRRILEMYVGIVCACTPSAAKSFKRHVQQFNSFRSYISSYLPVSSLRQSKASSSSKSNALSKDKERFKQRQYLTIDEIYRSAQGKGKSTSTFIQSGKQHNVENDGIHLTYEMQNEVSRAEH